MIDIKKYCKVSFIKMIEKKSYSSKIWGRSLLHILFYFFLFCFFILQEISCCSRSTLRLPYVAKAETFLSWKLKDNGRIRIYSLPSCCWPSSSQINDLLPYRSTAQLLVGLDAMVIDAFALLKNRSFALLTNSTGRNSQLKNILELMSHVKVRPKLLLEPEHGFYGSADILGSSGLRYEKRYNIPILSLYSKRRKPSSWHLRNIDVVVVDIQNLPVRCYTYISTLTYLMEVAEKKGIELMILDRPNPYGFWKAQGSYLQKGYESFVSKAPVPFLYSLTTAEYALYMADVRFHELHLEIVKVGGYEREDADVHLRHSWVNPSPNIPSLETALVYPGMVFFEGMEFSLGRGTTRPFVYSGSPWLKNGHVVRALRAKKLPGVDIAEINFEPTASYYKGKVNRGVMIVPKSLQFDSLRTGYEYMHLVKHFHKKKYFRFLRSKDKRFFIDKLWGGPGYRRAIMNNLDYDAFKESWVEDAKHFEEKTKIYRLY